MDGAKRVIDGDKRSVVGAERVIDASGSVNDDSFVPIVGAKRCNRASPRSGTVLSTFNDGVGCFRGQKREAEEERGRNCTFNEFKLMYALSPR